MPNSHQDKISGSNINALVVSTVCSLMRNCESVITEVVIELHVS